MFSIKNIQNQSTMQYFIPLRYTSLAWAQNTNSVKRINLLRKKSLRMIYFRSQNSRTAPLLKDSKIIKSFGKTTLENSIFISKFLRGLLPSAFNGWFNFFFECHSYDTRWANLGYLKIPSY